VSFTISQCLLKFMSIDSVTLSNHLILWPLDVKSPLVKILVLGKIEGKGRREWQRMRWLDSVTESMDMNLSKHWEIVKDTEA